MVPAAILFDLNNGGDKDWGDNPPYYNLGIEAASQAKEEFELGNAGAGYGSQAGALKGGLGSASFESDSGLKIGGLFAVNSFGSVVNNETGQSYQIPVIKSKTPPSLLIKFIFCLRFLEININF